MKKLWIFIFGFLIITESVFGSDSLKGRWTKINLKGSSNCFRREVPIYKSKLKRYQVRTTIYCLNPRNEMWQKDKDIPEYSQNSALSEIKNEEYKQKPSTNSSVDLNKQVPHNKHPLDLSLPANLDYSKVTTNNNINKPNVVHDSLQEAFDSSYGDTERTGRSNSNIRWNNSIDSNSGDYDQNRMNVLNSGDEGDQ